jgi:hypothetical protein
MINRNEKYIYLEDVLQTLESKQNVMIMLSTAQALFTEEDKEPVYIPDCIGNHYTVNWLTAIKECHLYKRFIVKAKVNNNDVIKIYLQNYKGETGASLLELGSNEAAIKTAIENNKEGN